MPVTVLPDAETLAVAALAAQASITAICSTRIGTRIPDAPTFPLIRVAKVGDYGVDPEGSSVVVIQVECWADDDATASLLARTVQSCYLDLRRITGGGWTALTDIPSGPIPTPDPESGRARYLLELDMRIGA
jgi:hypothetical protein